VIYMGSVIGGVLWLRGREARRSEAREADSLAV